jgi:hypothetical protein
MTIVGRVVRWLRGWPVWAGNRYDPGDTIGNLPKLRYSATGDYIDLGCIPLR